MNSQVLDSTATGLPLAGQPLAPQPRATTRATASAQPSPTTLVWRRFRAQRLGFWSLILLVGLLLISLFGEVISNDNQSINAHAVNR